MTCCSSVMNFFLNVRAVNVNKNSCVDLEDMRKWQMVACKFDKKID